MASILGPGTARPHFPISQCGRGFGRALLLAASASFATGCVHDPQFDFASAGRRVALLPVDAEIVERQVHQARELREDWSATARDRFSEALRGALEARGYSVVEGDPASLGVEVDFLVHSEVRDAHDSGEVTAQKVALGIVLLPLSLLLGAPLEVGSPSEEAAGIWFEQASTSDSVWSVRKDGRLWDVRNKLGAWRNVQKLMSDFPIKPQRGKEAVSETPNEEPVAERAEAPIR